VEAKGGSPPRSLDWPTRLSRRAVSPAAGSAAALTAAMGVGLLIKLARRTESEEIPEHRERLARLLEARGRFAITAEDDASAIRDWLSAEGLEEDDPTRQAAVEALITVPLEAAELCDWVRNTAELLLQRGHALTIPDGRAGMRLITTSQEIFCTLVEADLGAVANRALVNRIQQRLEKVKSCRAETATCQER